MGKNIAITGYHSLDHEGILDRLRAWKISEDSVNFVIVAGGQANRLAALESGSVSAVALGSLATWPASAAVVVAGYPYYFSVILDYRHTVGVARLSYAAAVVVVVADALVPRLRRRDPGQVERSTAIEAAVASRAVPGGIHGPTGPACVDECLEPARRRLSAAGLQDRT